ncbi:MAG: DUF4091 domain-containing protein [Phycisphaerae bacterium]|nr:DUF4091 domain-containing protein [Phycisphaerae bacterium]
MSITRSALLILIGMSALHARGEQTTAPAGTCNLETDLVVPNEPSRCTLGVASPMVKVFREAADFRGSFNPVVRLAAAGRERESFQLVVLPLKTKLQQVSFECTDLVHEGSETRIPAKEISWNPVGYVQTKKSNSSIRRVGWWWPDILLPQRPFDVEPGFVQPVWFTVHTPAETRPGIYRGLVRLHAEGKTLSVARVELTARAFSLPVSGKLKTAFSICPGLWEIWYKPDEVKKRLGLTDQAEELPLHSAIECEDVLPREKWFQMYDFLLEHRLSPCSIYSKLRNGTYRMFPRTEDLDYCYERGMNTVCLGNVDVPEAAVQPMKELESWLGKWKPIIEKKAWPDVTWFVHGFDESDMRPDHEQKADPAIRMVYGMIGEKFPMIRRESANPVNPAHFGLFDIWTPLTSQWNPDYVKRQQSGDEVWAYVCCGPTKPHANLFVDFPGTDPRILPWQYYKHGITGFLYYHMHIYLWQENWNLNAPKWPEREWNTLSFGTGNDGILFYPGPDATPLASTRLENLRDGIEDYEALVMLAELADGFRAAGRHNAFVSRARKALAVRPELVRTWTEYTDDPEQIVQARGEVDALIEEALRLAD